ncbi:hypothetical protein ES708_23036 [subsurface metagenome]
MESYTRGQEVREQYAEWLQGYNWDYFATITFRKPRKEPYLVKTPDQQSSPKALLYPYYR